MIPAIMAIIFVLVGAKFVAQSFSVFIIGLGHIRKIEGFVAWVFYIAAVFLLALPFAAIEYARA